jgi:hypothetical protein
MSCQSNSVYSHYIITREKTIKKETLKTVSVLDVRIL